MGLTELTTVDDAITCACANDMTPVLYTTMTLWKLLLTMKWHLLEAQFPLKWYLQFLHRDMILITVMPTQALLFMPPESQTARKIHTNIVSHPVSEKPVENPH